MATIVLSLPRRLDTDRLQPSISCAKQPKDQKRIRLTSCGVAMIRSPVFANVVVNVVPDRFRVAGGPESKYASRHTQKDSSPLPAFLSRRAVCLSTELILVGKLLECGRVRQRAKGRRSNSAGNDQVGEHGATLGEECTIAKTKSQEDVKLIEAYLESLKMVGHDFFHDTGVLVRPARLGRWLPKSWLTARLVACPLSHPPL